MRPDDLRELLREQPFQPFTLYVLDGTSYAIRHPELAIVGRSTVRIGIAATDSASNLPDRLVILALLHISRIERFNSSGTPAIQ
jgi:hypothetical protein